MVGLAELLAAFAWTFGANGFLVERQLGVGGALPSAWVAPVAEQAWLVFHDREDWAMAFYVPPAESPDLGGDPGRPDVPRLFLFAPYYLAPDGLAPLSEMPVDVAEYYFHALLEASLDLLPGESAYAAWAAARADELMAEVPEAQRRAAYRAALSDFGAHLLSIANEISRAARRQAAAGRDVCQTLELPASLFGHWERSFSAGGFRGVYYAPNGRRLESRRDLNEMDKERFLRQVLGVSWSGNPAEDFAGICPVSA